MHLDSALPFDRDRVARFAGQLGKRDYVGVPSADFLDWIVPPGMPPFTFVETSRSVSAAAKSIGSRIFEIRFSPISRTRS